MIRLRQTDDLEAVIELNRDIFPSTGAIPEDELEASVWWLAYLGSQPVGFGGVLLEPAHSRAYLARAGVLKEARGMGLQQRLVRARCAHATRAGLPRVYTYVWAGNVASMRNLVKCGFLPYYTERTPAAGGGVVQTFVYLEKFLKSGKRTGTVDLGGDHACSTRSAA